MDLLLEAAGLRGEGGDQGEETKSSCINEEGMSSSGITKKYEKGTDEEEDCDVSDQLSCLSSEEEYEPQEVSLLAPATNDKTGSGRKRRLTEDGDETIADSRKQSCLQHNENERKRRKSMKYAVHTLREQLTRKTRKPAVNTVLLAAYDEIQDLKCDESEKEDILETLKNRNIVLKYLLEKEINELKKQSPLKVITCHSSTSSDVIVSKDNPPPPPPATLPPPAPLPPPPGVPIYIPSPGPADRRESHHGTISRQWQPHLVSRSSPPPLSPLPPPPPLISTKIVSSPTYISPPPPRIPPPPPLPSAPSIISPSTRFITYPVSPAAVADLSNHFSPAICSPSTSFFPFVPIPTQPLTMPPMYYPPNALLQLTTSAAAAAAGFRPVVSTRHQQFTAAAPTAIQAIPLFKEVESSEQKPIQLQSPLQNNRHLLKEAKHMELNYCKSRKHQNVPQLSRVEPAHQMVHVHNHGMAGHMIGPISTSSSSIACGCTIRPISVITDNQSHITDNQNPPITNSP